MLKRKNSVVGRGGKCYEKSGKLVEICTNFEELRGIWEYHQILSPKIVVFFGGGDSWKLGGKFPKKWSWGGGLQLATGEKLLPKNFVIMLIRVLALKMFFKK